MHRGRLNGCAILYNQNWVLLTNKAFCNCLAFPLLLGTSHSSINECCGRCSTAAGTYWTVAVMIVVVLLEIFAHIVVGCFLLVHLRCFFLPWSPLSRTTTICLIPASVTTSRPLSSSWSQSSWSILCCKGGSSGWTLASSVLSFCSCFSTWSLKKSSFPS